MLALSPSGPSQVANSTHCPGARSWVRLLARAVAFTTILALVLSWSPGPARADGDPASDVLVSQTLFLPQDAGVTAEQQAQLDAELGAAQRSGYRLRVAIIGSATDLGSVTELWRQPESYARFLGLELSLVYHGPLLVIMPNGFGTYRLGPSTTVRPALTDVRGRGLGAVAIAAIQRLAAASGHPVTVPDLTVRSTRDQTDAVSWIVLAIGGALIAVAWSASLRARPLRLRGS